MAFVENFYLTAHIIPIPRKIGYIPGKHIFDSTAMPEERGRSSGSARGLVPPTVFPVSLPCHWRRRFRGSRKSEVEGNWRREAVVNP